MKQLKFYFVLMLAIAFAIQSPIAFAQTASVHEYPDWESDADWSLNAPVANGRTVQDAILFHNSTIDYSMDIGDSIAISTGVTFTTSENIKILPGGEFHIVGEVMLTDKSIRVLPGGIIHIHDGGQLVGMADVELKDLSGTFIIDEGGSMEWTGDWKLNGGSGTTMTINGAVTIAGDLDNKIDIDGEGSITLDGVLNNFPNASIFGCTLPGDECCLGQTPCVLGGAIPLGVDLLSFDVYLKKRNVHLEWTTASETSNDCFFIDRSIDAIHWVQIAEITGHGDRTGVSRYEYLDLNPILGRSFYRLAQRDHDGTVIHLKIASVANGNSKAIFLIYPNPANDKVTITLGNHDGAVISILDHLGRRVGGAVVQFEQFEIDVSAYPAGMYFVELKKGDLIEIHKLLVQ
jgi:hypothetical protein